MSLNFSRYVEWSRVIRAEFPDWRQLVLAIPPMIWHGLNSVSNPAPKRIWRQRIRICHKCLIYNPALRQCRRKSQGGVELGCGCYTPFLATLRTPHKDEPGCWLYSMTSSKYSRFHSKFPPEGWSAIP